MPEKHSKNDQKIFSKNVNPHGNGVLRFQVFDILEKSNVPLTVSEVQKKVLDDHPGIKGATIRKILHEIAAAAPGGRKVHKVIKRVICTKCEAFYIHKPIPKSKMKQDVL